MNKKKICLLILGLNFALNFIYATEIKKTTDKFGNSIIIDWGKFSAGLISPENSLVEIMNRGLNVTKNDWKGRQTLYGRIYFTLKTKEIVPKRRTELIEYLTIGVNDTNAWRDVLRHLTTFKKNDFSENAIDILRKYYENVKLNYYNILLYGIIDIHIRDQEILKLSQEPLEEDGRWLFGHRWVARLVMARRGNKKAIEEVKQNALDILEFENLTIDKDGIPSVTRHKKRREKGIHGQAAVYLFKNIAYIKQPESVVLLWAVLNSDEKIDKHTLFADCALTGLTILIDDFPVKRFPALSYPDGEIAKGRKWMAINGERIRKSFETKSSDKKY